MHRQNNIFVDRTNNNVAPLNYKQQWAIKYTDTKYVIIIETYY